MMHLRFVCDQGKWESKTIGVINLIIAEANALHVEKIVANGRLSNAPYKNVNYNLLRVGFFPDKYLKYCCSGN